MSTWSDTTGAQLTAEIEALKAARVAAYLATHGGGTRQLTSTERSELTTVCWRAIADAIMTHIGPVSSDGSVLFGIQTNGDGVPQLDIRTTGGGVHTPIQSITTASGVMTPVAISKAFEVYGSEDFLGIDGTVYVPGDVIHLVIREARTIRTGATVVAPVLPFELTSQGTETPQDLITDAKFRISFMNYGGAWMQFTPPVTI